LSLTLNTSTVPLKHILFIYIIIIIIIIIISHVNEYNYLGVRITEDGNHEPEINDGINTGRAAIKKLNSNLCDRDVTVM